MTLDSAIDTLFIYNLSTFNAINEQLIHQTLALRVALSSGQSKFVTVSFEHRIGSTVHKFTFFLA